MEDRDVVRAIRRWVETVVVELDLCPFANRELVNNRVRFAVTAANSEQQLLMALEAELQLLSRDPSVETTLLIHPRVLDDFYDYNEFLGVADRLLVEMTLEGVYQIASFHPRYQFSGTHQDAAENYTNRSPYPVLHMIREESLDKVIAGFPDVDQIPRRNIKLMNSLGQKKLQALVQACFDAPKAS
ncbi:MAG: DUF1415 domain-containing protein [Gammaproteobacteria bacterium]